MYVTLLKWSFPLILFSCSNNRGNEVPQRVAYIDEIVDSHNKAMHRVKTDTIVNGDTKVYTSYFFNNQKNLKFISIAEPDYDLKYIGHFNNDTLIRLSVEKRDVNYSSDEAAVYYLMNDSVIFKKEPRIKIENLKKLIADQQTNAVKFNQLYKESVSE